MNTVLHSPGSQMDAVLNQQHAASPNPYPISSQGKPSSSTYPSKVANL